MGFRSTFVTDDPHLPFPPWFVEKWAPYVHFGEGNGLPLASKCEAKIYQTWYDLEADIGRVLAEQNKADIGQQMNPLGRVVLVWLHECGGITRAEISATGVRYSEPTGWAEEDHPTHSYCYGCSDLPAPEPPR